MQCHDAVGVPSLVIRQPGQIMAPNISLLLLNHPLTCTVKLESPRAPGKWPDALAKSAGLG